MRAKDTGMRAGGPAVPPTQPPPRPIGGGLPLPAHARRDIALAEAAEAFTEACRTATAALLEFKEAWQRNRET